jgi:hypothetical protein
MPSIRSEGYKALSKGDRYLPKTNNNEPFMAAVDTILKFTLPIVVACMTIKGAADVIKSFKGTYGNNNK